MKKIITKPTRKPVGPRKPGYIDQHVWDQKSLPERRALVKSIREQTDASKKKRELDEHAANVRQQVQSEERGAVDYVVYAMNLGVRATGATNLADLTENLAKRLTLMELREALRTDRESRDQRRITDACAAADEPRSSET